MPRRGATAARPHARGDGVRSTVLADEGGTSSATPPPDDGPTSCALEESCLCVRLGSRLQLRHRAGRTRCQLDPRLARGAIGLSDVLDASESDIRLTLLVLLALLDGWAIRELECHDARDGEVLAICDLFGGEFRQ